MGREAVRVSGEVLSQIAEAIRTIRYGSVQITIQDSRVIQIEKAEKIRLQKGADLTAGGKEDDASRADRTTGGPRTLDGS